jgi:hypothetical protein
MPHRGTEPTQIVMTTQKAGPLLRSNGMFPTTTIDR